MSKVKKQEKQAKPAKKRKLPKKSIRSGRGTLLFLSVVLIGSVGVRLYSGAGEAIAKEFAELTSEETPEMAVVDPMACMPDEELNGLIQVLRKREAMVSEKELEIEQKMAVVDLARSEIEESFKALELAEERLQSTMALSETAAEDDLSKLTSVYENMKPKDAAALFEAMAPDFAAGFLGRMRADAAADILTGLKPETAYTISVILAGRNASAPSE